MNPIFVMCAFSAFLIMYSLRYSPSSARCPCIVHAEENKLTIAQAKKHARGIQVLLIVFALMLLLIPYDYWRALQPML